MKGPLGIVEAVQLRNEDDVKNTLLHEMIHALMLTQDPNEDDPHGSNFTDKMDFINGATCTDNYVREKLFSFYHQIVGLETKAGIQYHCLS